MGESLPSPGLIGLAFLVGALSYGLSIQLFILALRGLGAVRTGALFGIAPFVGATLSLFFFHEAPQTFFWLALPLMLSGAWLMFTESHQHYHVHVPLKHAHAHSHPDEHHNHSHPSEEPLVNGRHAHVHTHAEMPHSHPHAPDLHHRHLHANGDDKQKPMG